MFRQFIFYTRGGATSRWHFAGDRGVEIMKKMENHCSGSKFRRVFARWKWNRKNFLLQTQSKQLIHIVHTWGRGQKMCFRTSSGRFEIRNYGRIFRTDKGRLAQNYGIVYCVEHTQEWSGFAVGWPKKLCAVRRLRVALTLGASKCRHGSSNFFKAPQAEHFLLTSGSFKKM